MLTCRKTRSLRRRSAPVGLWAGTGMGEAVPVGFDTIISIMTSARQWNPLGFVRDATAAPLRPTAATEGKGRRKKDGGVKPPLQRRRFEVLLDEGAEDVAYGDVGFLDALGVLRGNVDEQVGAFAERAAEFAGEGGDPGATGASGLGGEQDVGAGAAGGERDEDVAGAGEGFHLAGEDLLVAVIVGGGGEHRSVDGEGEGGHGGAMRRASAATSETSSGGKTVLDVAALLELGADELFGSAGYG